MPSYRNQSIDLANQLIGFYMMAALAFNDLKIAHLVRPKGLFVSNMIKKNEKDQGIPLAEEVNSFTDIFPADKSADSRTH